MKTNACQVGYGLMYIAQPITRAPDNIQQMNNKTSTKLKLGRLACNKTSQQWITIHTQYTWYVAIKLSHTCYRVLSPALIPAYRQSTHRWLFKSSPRGRLPLLTARPASLPRKRSPDGATTDWGGKHLIAAHYSFIDPERMKGWVGWPPADGLTT